MKTPYQFNRNEFAGSLGDLGTLLPIALGMVLINGLYPSGVFFSIGLFYILAGLYFGITVPIQPMKVIGAYAVAAEMSVQQIQASILLMAVTLFIIAVTGTMNAIGKITPKPVIRGVQLSTGLLLMLQGFKMILGTSTIQAVYKAAEPYLRIQSVGSIPVGLIIGGVGAILVFLFLNNKKLPAGVILIGFGLCIGLLLGSNQGFEKIAPGIYFPEVLPYPYPVKMDFTFAIFALVLPQIPMTLGNAVIANADLAGDYFGTRAKKMSYKALCLSMAVGNMISFAVGGMAMCHGAGGLAAHYRFGARTAGSNLMIGTIFILLVVFFGKGILSFLFLIPVSILGVLLLFAGGQLAMTISDMKRLQDISVIIWMAGVTFLTNLAVAFITGLIMVYLINLLLRRKNGKVA